MIRNILLILLIIFLIAVLYQFLDTYVNVPAEQLAFHLQVPIEGTSTSIILDFLKWPLVIVLVSILCIILIICIEIKILKRKSFYLNIKLKNKSEKIKILPIDFASWKIKIILLIILVCAVIFTGSKMDIIAFIQNQFMESELIEDEYVDPNSVEISFPKEKQNLIYIYN